MKRTFLALAMATLSSTAFATTLATVDGYDIDSSVVDSQITAFSKQYQDFKDTPEVRQQILTQLVNQRAIVAASQKSDVKNTEQFKVLLKSAEEELTYNLFINSLAKKASDSVTDAEIKALYDQYAKQPKPEEAKVRHILVKTEKEANQIIKSIKAKKTTLEKEAKKVSLDTATKENGGLIDYTEVSVFVPEFSAAVEKAKKGLITTPVKTQFGYHVIEVLDKRTQPTPSLDAVKEELKQILVRDKTNELIQDSIKSIKVEYAK